jgi:hypothetical protein
MRRIPILLLLFAPHVFAADEPATTCTDTEVYAALDFWVGEWDVYVDEELVGRNRIEKILSGCAVMEHWRAAGGGEGKSLFFVSGDGTWKQVWVTEWATRTGGVKEKTLQAVDAPNRVRFQGRIALPDAGYYLDRTTLTLLPSGEVRQVIETSSDEGRSWTTGFDAIYRRSD